MGRRPGAGPGRRRRAILGAAAGAAVVLLGAGPALAGPPSISVTAPSDGAVLGTASPQISGTVSSSAPAGVVTGSLYLDVASDDGHPGWESTVPSWCGRQSCSFTESVSPGLAYNGQYQLSVSAQETDPPLGSTHTASWTGGFSVAVPPVSPGGVTATPASDGSSITLSWQSNPEPDIVGYQVSRSPASPGSWPQAVTETDLVDTSVSPGQAYTYTVTAVRQGASSGSVVYSSPTSVSVTDPSVTDAGPGSSASGSSGAGGAGSSGSGSSGAGSGAGAGSPSGAGAGAGATSSASGPGGSADHGAGSGSSSGPPSLGTYGKATSGPSGGSHNLSSFDQLVHKTAASQAAASGAGSSNPAATAASLPALGDGVAPGSDNPEVAPFSSGSSQTRAEAGGQATVSYSTTTENHGAVVRDFAAVGLAALLLAVVAHLLWLRRAARLSP